MSSNSYLSEQASFLQTRDPSICGWDQRAHFVAPVRKQLFDGVLEEESEDCKRSNFSTFLRLKPSSAASDENTFSVLNDTTIVINPPKESATFKNNISGRVVHQYTFTKVFRPDTTQKEVFDECVAYQIKDFILGSNCLLFAYGTTNAGKTHTIQGNGSSPGIIPRSLDLLFKSIHGQVSGVGRYKPDKVQGIVQLDSSTIALEQEYKSRILLWNWDKPLEPIKSGVAPSCDLSGGSESDFISNTFREMQKTLSHDSPIDMSTEGDVVYGVWVSFAEVYNECIYDLLDPILTRNRKRVPLKMSQDSEGITFIKDLKMIHVSSGDEAFHVMLYGKANLQVAATNMNSRSSRSHCLFTIKLVRYANSDDPTWAVVSSFTFCDLAGAERVKKTLNAGERLKESNNINSSLHVLGRCLATIRDNQKKKEKKPVPYRDSKLTRIFQRALTGHEKITMLVNVNPTPILFDETVNVLKFSAIAKHIVLETPIKKSKPAAKKSRFSIMVTRPNHHGTICWDAPVDDHDKSNSSQCSNVNIQKYNAQNEELLQLVEKLKLQLAQEREKNLTLERNIRQTMTQTFSKMITDMQDKHKLRLRDATERCESLAAWRITQVENYYKMQLEEKSRKRRRNSNADDSIVECDSSDQTRQIQELQEELNLCENKYSAVHTLLKEAQEMQASLTADNTSLKFELSNMKEELAQCRRQLLAAETQDDGCHNSLSKELASQLQNEKDKVADLVKKNENLKELLEEAKNDFIMMNKDCDEASNKAEILERELAEKVDELADIINTQEDTQQLLIQKTRSYDRLEEQYESLKKIHENCERSLNATSTSEDTDERQLAIEELQEIQLQLQSLSVSGNMERGDGCEGSKKGLLTITQSLSGSVKSKLEENADLNREIKELRKQLQELNQTILSRDERLGVLETQKNSLECEISHLNGKLKELECTKDENLKAALQDNIKINQKLMETQTELENSKSCSDRLEKELKSVLQKSNSQLNLSMSSQIEIETLGSKVKTYEETMKLLKEWKDGANVEIEQLKKELKELRDENLRCSETLQIKDAEIDKIHEHRTKLINGYESVNSKLQEELEMEKREVLRLRDALYKSTPTPKKNDSAEIRRLKDLVETLQAEISHRNYNDLPSAKKNSRSAKKTAVTQECNNSGESVESIKDQPSAKKNSRSAKKTVVTHESNNSEESVESIKENMEFLAPSSAFKSRRATNADTKLKSDEAVPLAEQAESKPQRRARRLFSRQQQTESFDSDVEQVEDGGYLPHTKPESIIKRSLRNRKE
ncbi:Kinesin-like protein KIF20A [Frankliniella fusca]|uniref:Kinesin-like protein KIF20A n=1 Tax=Frankliniella fusca TaxID=407009 RepID=A0AAE1HLJ4_9NEOP|nr:Kinesin-like protein KIF20A [Frankliniella fusca]